MPSIRFHGSRSQITVTECAIFPFTPYRMICYQQHGDAGCRSKSVDHWRRIRKLLNSTSTT
uniref:Uncharacterized protein n=1 Tax=Arundo donax TaxID=35708 RepID=A0A0A9GSJ0_ARUDO